MTKFDQFAKLHVAGNPLLLFNVWDPGSAIAVANAGAMAIATGSASVAAANGYGDGEKIPIALVIENAARIVQSVDQPVTVDFEGGYAQDESSLSENVRRLLGTGAVGCNFEDQVVGTDRLYLAADQAKRIGGVRHAAGAEFFINARTDIFLKAPVASHDEAMVDEALERARVYADAGASGFFVPLLSDLKLLARMCARSPLPVNFMAFPDCPTNAQIAATGVARISHGPFPHRRLMAKFTQMAKEAAS